LQRKQQTNQLTILMQLVVLLKYQDRCKTQDYHILIYSL